MEHIIKEEQHFTENESEISTDDESDDEYTSLTSSSITISYEAIGKDNSAERKGTVFSSIFTLVSTMNGGGILSVPYAFQQGGYAVATLVLMLVAMGATYSALLIIRSKKYCRGRVKTMEDVARFAFGKTGQVAMQMLIIINCFLTAVAYLLLFTEQVGPLMTLVGGGHGMWTTKIFLLSIALVVVFPMCLMKNMSAMKYTSFLSVTCNLLLCGCIAYRSSQSNLGGPLNPPHHHHHSIKPFPQSVRGLLNCVAIVNVLFSCHFNVLPMHVELRHQTTSNKRVILTSSMVLTFIINGFMGFFGYFQFREMTAQVITKNYFDYDVIINIGRGALCCTLLLNIPLFILPMRNTINKMIWYQNSLPSFMIVASNRRMNGPNKLVHCAETMILVVLCYLFAYVIPQIGVIWGFVGAVICTSLIYIFPPAFYLRIRKPMRGHVLKTVSSVALIIIGAVVLVAGFYQAVANVIRTGFHKHE